MELERMTAKEVAEYLGICLDTVYKMVRKNEIPHFRLRRRIMFTKESINQWIRDQESDFKNDAV